MTALLTAFSVFIVPITDAFRGNGTPSQPEAVMLPIHKVFSDASGVPMVELLGVDIQQTVQPGEQVSARLYWHALRKLDAGWRVALKLQDSLHSIDWANSDNTVPGGYSTSDWSLDRYVVDTHLLTIRPDTLPYLDDLTVLIYNDAGTQLKADSATITQVRVSDNQCDAPPTTATVRYGNLITLNGYALNNVAGHVTLDLYWHVDAALSADYALFIHMMAGNTTTANADTSPIDAYPSHEWQAGQCLHNRYLFDSPSGVDRILIGFYQRDNGARLPAISSSPLEADGLVIPLR
ncbi:MAG: hypothetical protein ACYDBJ_12970 [Aggregatilineales bacterium]